MITTTLTITAETKEQFIELLKEGLKQVEENDDYIAHRIGDKNLIDGEIIDTEEQKSYWEKQSEYPLSNNQIQFCVDAEEQGMDINFAYSGRGMFGKTCPAVSVDDREDFSSESKKKFDGMGRGYVVYAQY